MVPWGPVALFVLSVRGVFRIYLSWNLMSLNLWGSSGTVGSSNFTGGIKVDLAEENLAYSFLLKR